MPDNMMRTAGRSKDGLAKAIKTDNDGSLFSRGESEIIAWTKDNPTPNRGVSDFEIRDTDWKYHNFPHLREVYDQTNYTNIFDQTFTIASRLDAEVEVTLSLTEAGSGAIVTFELMTYTIGTIPASTGSVRTLTLTPEKSNLALNSTAQVIEVPELRQGFPCFRFNIRAKTAPTSGDIRILNTRRY